MILKKCQLNFFFNKLFWKIFIIFILIICLFSYKENWNNNNYELNNFYEKSLNKTINIGLVSNSLKNGGRERSASLICNHFSKIKKFKLFLFTLREKENNEFYINENIERIVVKQNLITVINQTKIDILLYQIYNYRQIYELIKLKHIKVIIINRSCFLHWIYYDSYNIFKTYYRMCENSECTVSLVPFENDYLFRKWGINSVLISNFITYEYNDITPSDLSSNLILMIGRGDDKTKRFDLGIKLWSI